MTERFYSLEEASALLPEVAELVRSLTEAHAVMDARHEAVTDSIPTNGGGAVHREFLNASLSATAALTRLDELEIIVRDPGSGLIDFPSIRDGVEVYLCWKLGEESIGWWHPPETGFAGRRPL